MSSIDKDRETADLVIEGLEAAMADKGIEAEEINHDGYGQQRLNKLIYSGLHWRYQDDIPVQRSWHRYGVELGNAIKDHTLIHPSPVEDFVDAESPSARNKLKQVEEYHYYFKDDFALDGMGLQETIDADFHDLLEAFYSRYADPAYRDLYLANVEIQRRLATDSSSLSADNVTQDDCLELGDLVTDLHSELFCCNLLHDAPSNYTAYAKEEGFDSYFYDFDAMAEEAFDRIERFTDLYEDIYMKLSEQSSEDVVGDPESIIEGLEVFYHEFAWKSVTELMSIKTATGRNHQELWKGSMEELDWIVSAYDEKFSKHAHLASQANLLPDVDDYQFDAEDFELLQKSNDVSSIYSD